MPLYRYRPNRLRRALPNIVLTALVVLVSLALSSLGERASRPLSTPLVSPFAGILALDFSAYVAHVALHKLPVAWRFHRVHHSEDEVDVTTAFRQHPAETIWRILWQLPAIVLLALPPWVVVVYVTISSLNAQLEHANIRLQESLDRILRLLFVTPNMHKTHHSRAQHETDSNYANIFSIWDRMFGTYTRDVDFARLRYGLDEHQPHGLRELLAMPFVVKPRA
jgi:sterol desaturase/sphingolipid hydroxylase (fatty acid hydroxylase superfamily)